MYEYPQHPDFPDPRTLADNPADAALRAEAAAVEAENTAARNELLKLNEQEEAQQSGRGVTRRLVLGGAALATTALATANFAHLQVSFAATNTGTLVHVFLYGGLDGLSLAAPANDPVLNSTRPNLTLPERDSMAVGRNFMLSSAFAPLQKYLKAGKLALIPGVSDPRLTESHFQAQDTCNLGGLPAEVGGRGWLDTLVGVLGKGTAFRSVGIGTTLPRSQVGVQGALALNSVASLDLNGDGRYKAATVKAIESLFTGINHPLSEAVTAGLGALSAAQKIAAKPYQPAAGVQYEGMGQQFRELSRLIKGGANVRVATIGLGGWDTHEGQGTRQGGYLYGQLNGLAKALAAFFDDLGPKSDDVTVMVTSEFGRRVAENGGGTDHGHGGTVVLLSGKKLSNPLLGTWGGLQKLDFGNVPEYNNMFDIYGSVAQARFDLTHAQAQKVFPGHKFSAVPLFA